MDLLTFRNVWVEYGDKVVLENVQFLGSGRREEGGEPADAGNAGGDAGRGSAPAQAPVPAAAAAGGGNKVDDDVPF